MSHTMITYWKAHFYLKMHVFRFKIPIFYSKYPFLIQNAHFWFIYRFKIDIFGSKSLFSIKKRISWMSSCSEVFDGITMFFKTRCFQDQNDEIHIYVQRNLIYVDFCLYSAKDCTKRYVKKCSNWSFEQP